LGNKEICRFECSKVSGNNDTSPSDSEKGMAIDRSGVIKDPNRLFRLRDAEIKTKRPFIRRSTLDAIASLRKKKRIVGVASVYFVPPQWELRATNGDIVSDIRCCLSLIFK